jgi:AcrR family transcriptional regulator
MPNKKPRRTAERILDVTLALFNRFGEPNVSTSQLCGELGISPGNLFYHHATRDALVHGLFERYQEALSRGLGEAPQGDENDTLWPEASPALQALTRLCEHMARTAWTYRFLFRDLSDLVSRHRLLEEQMPPLLRLQAARLLQALRQQGWNAPTPEEVSLRLWTGPVLATLSGSMGLDGAMDPREHWRENEDQVCERAVCRALGLIGHGLRPQDQQAIAGRIARTEHLGQDPWWLINPEG